MPGAAAARDALRRMPAELKRAVKDDVLDAVTRPLAAKVAQAAGGPYGAALAGAVRARKDVDPVIVVGGQRRALSGGARLNDLWGGVEFGSTGTKRVTYRRAYRGGPTHTVRRRTTRQFAGRGHHPFIFPTFAAQSDTTYTAWEDAVYGRLLDLWGAGS